MVTSCSQTGATTTYSNPTALTISGSYAYIVNYGQ